MCFGFDVAVWHTCIVEVINVNRSDFLYARQRLVLTAPSPQGGRCMCSVHLSFLAALRDREERILKSDEVSQDRIEEPQVGGRHWCQDIEVGNHAWATEIATWLHPETLICGEP